jgi:hypothetical protein
MVTSFTAMMCLEDSLLRWWQHITFTYAISITVLLPFVWVLACTALTKVATELADDMEKVRN